MPYSEMMVKPMREEMVDMGAKELKTVTDVDAELGDQQGTTLVFVNSVCGCAAGGDLPALRAALHQGPKTDKVVTISAGQDTEAVARARQFFADYQPSSPSMALFKDGEVVHFIHRHQIEGKAPQDVANNLSDAFKKYCAPASA